MYYSVSWATCLHRGIRGITGELAQRECSNVLQVQASSSYYHSRPLTGTRTKQGRNCDLEVYLHVTVLPRLPEVVQLMPCPLLGDLPRVTEPDRQLV